MVHMVPSVTSGSTMRRKYGHIAEKCFILNVDYVLKYVQCRYDGFEQILVDWNGAITVVV